MKRKVFFRADAGAGIGYGHFIRSLALADIIKNDFECVIFTQSPTSYQIEEAQKVCKLISLPNDERKFDMFLDYLSGDEIVVLDNYFYSTAYQKQIRTKGCKLICIDDIHDKHYLADIVINHGIVPLNKFDVEAYSHVCIGPKYALLRAPFFNIIHKPKRRGSWVVTLGGLDEPNLTCIVVKLLQKVGIVDIIAIVGDGYKHIELLRKTGVKIFSRLTAQQMAETFATVENVICSASTVSYEAMSQGCIVYSGWYVDNQIEIFAGQMKEQYIVPLGNLFKINANILLQNVDIKKISFSGVQKRLRGLFLCISSNWIKYENLSLPFSKRVWECRNLKEIRSCMLNQNQFSFESHQNFINQLKNNSEKYYEALFYNGEFIASYNLTNIQNRKIAERGIFINPTYQGMSVGCFLETRMIYIAKNIFGIKFLRAVVLKSNIHSINFHKSLGYKIISENYLQYIFEKEL